MNINRRTFVLATAALPLAGCAAPKTPLAHLHGRDWVTGAYELYGKTYLDVQKKSEQLSHEAYRMIAQRGVSALDGLQSREVPFNIQVDDSEKGFLFQRDVPTTLMFRADMNEADRQAATAAWEKAREHIQTDYVEIRRLEWSLTRLLEQLQRVRTAIDASQDEQYNIVRQIGAMKAGKLPFPLPVDVSTKDYEEVLLLLIDRLDDDRTRLQGIEATLLAVGLTVRATDARSASLSANIRKVLLTVTEDVTAPRPVAFPRARDERDKLLARARERMAAILASEEYKAFLTRDRDRALEQIGMLLSIVDTVTGVPTSKIYRLGVNILKGEKDYFEYLKVLATMAPGGHALGKTIEKAIDLTEAVRKNASAIAKGDKAAIAGALINTATKLSRGQIGKQLAFFKDAKEAKAVEEALARTQLMMAPPPVVPGVTVP